MILLLILPLLVSCIKNEFDLDKITFPLDYGTLKQKYELRENSDFSGFIIYNSTDPSLLNFDGFAFAGMLSKADDSMFSANHVSFYENRTEKKINAYQLEIKTTKQAEKFEKLLEKKLGKTDFYYRTKEFSFRIWETDGKAYFLETNNTGSYNGEKFNSCLLYVVNSADKLLYNYMIAGGFQYYGDYLYEKNKPEHKGQPYTYRNFVEENEKEDGTDSFYVQDYVK